MVNQYKAPAEPVGMPNGSYSNVKIVSLIPKGSQLISHVEITRFIVVLYATENLSRVVDVFYYGTRKCVFRKKAKVGTSAGYTLMLETANTLATNYANSVKWAEHIQRTGEVPDPDESPF